MEDAERRMLELEGRLVAHRQVIGQIAALLDGGRRGDLAEWLATHSVMRDGQEDPGAVLDGAAVAGLAAATETRLIAEALEAAMSAAGRSGQAGRGAGQ